MNQLEENQCCEEEYNKIIDLNVVLNNINNLTIISLNIRSLNANFQTMETFLESFTYKSKIIVCTETWKLQHHQFYNLRGYKMFYNQGSLNKADGVVLYLADTISATVDIEELDCGVKIINCNFNFNKKNIKISAIYRCHACKKRIFVNSLKKFLNQNLNQKNHIIVGDFNIDLLNVNKVAEKFINCILEHAYLPYFNKITRPSDKNHKNGSCIDNFFVKLSSLDAKAFKYTVPLPDHYPLILNIKNKIIQTKINKTVINYNKIQKICYNENWYEIYEYDDPNIATEALIIKIQNVIKKATSKVNLNKHAPRKPWIDHVILKSIYTKEKLYTKFKKLPTLEKKINI